MEWIEVSVEVDGEAAEAVADVFARYGHQGVAIEQAGFEMEVWPDEAPPADRLIVRAYFPNDADAPAAQQKLREALWHMNQLYPMPQPTFKTVADEDWAEAWKRHYKPIRLGQRLYIRPEWIEVDDARPDDIMLVLDPGTAFGTGTHPTTETCLLALEELMPDWPGADVLDLGCGSGILGIAALRLGASRVLALDIADMAVRATLENAARNGVSDRLTAQQGSLYSLKSSARHFDLLLANILAKVIIEMCGEGLADVLRPGGVGIFSGLIRKQANDVEAALRAAGLEPVRRMVKRDWVTIVARKPRG